MIQIEFLIMSVALTFFWFLDEILTRLDIRRFGLKSEKNPLIRHLERKGEKYFFGFKLASLLVVLLLAYAMSLIHYGYGYWLLGGLTVIYLIVDLHNLEIYERY